MIEVVDVAAQAESSSTTSQTTMLEEIRAGLKKIPKQISAKYFYDERGSELFNLITRHPDYYLTQAEMEILQTCKNELTSFLQVPTFNLIELGPGEGIKTKVLIEQFKSEKIPFHYVPIDISKKYLNAIAEKFEPIISSILPIQTDYFHGLSWVRSHSHRRNFVLFLGSSIGNFSIIETKQFLANLYDHLNVGDLVLLGFDLRKDIDILMRAYNDSDGITRAFNFNLLTRLNRELQANFDLAQFKHYPAYNFYTQAMESFLVNIRCLQ
jgi:L-histidine Nalpha-methyltransferase